MDLIEVRRTRRDRIAGQEIVIKITPAGEIAAVLRASGENVPHMFVYWFAWQAVHPGRLVYR